MNVPEKVYSIQELDFLFKYQQAIQTSIEYVRDFAAKPHEKRMKPGAVCPFLPRSLRRNQVSLSIIDTPDLTIEKLQAIVETYIDAFKVAINKFEDKSMRRDYSWVLVFPAISATDAPHLIESVHRYFKKRLVYDGLMIGDFHPTSDATSLYNEEFFPLRASIPMIALRALIENDLPFLVRSQDTAETRIHFLTGYLTSLGNSLSPASKEIAEKALQQAEAEASVAVQ